MSKGTRRIRRRKGKRTRSCKCVLCNCKKCKCNMKNRRRLRRKGQRGGDLLNKISFGFLGKKEQKPELSNVAGNVAESPNDTPPDTNSQSQTPSPYETPTKSPNSPDFCNRCRDAHRSGECTLSIDDTGSGILKGAQDAATDMFNKTKKTVETATSDAQNVIANKVIDAGLSAKPKMSDAMASEAVKGGRKKRRKTKKGRKSRKGRKTRRKRKSSKRRKRRR